MMTREAAWMSFDEKRTGSLELGKWADMALLSANPLAVPKRELQNIQIQQLIMNGRPWGGAGTLPGLAMRRLRGHGAGC